MHFSCQPTPWLLFKSLNYHILGKLNWSFCVVVCMDAAAAVTGQLSGFTTWVKEVTSKRESIQYVICREVLASQKVSPELNDILQDVIKINNRVKVCPNSRLFTQPCEMATEHTQLL